MKAEFTIVPQNMHTTIIVDRVYRPQIPKIQSKVPDFDWILKQTSSISKNNITTNSLTFPFHSSSKTPTKFKKHNKQAGSWGMCRGTRKEAVSCLHDCRRQWQRCHSNAHPWSWTRCHIVGTSPPWACYKAYTQPSPSTGATSATIGGRDGMAGAFRHFISSTSPPCSSCCSFIFTDEGLGFGSVAWALVVITGALSTRSDLFWRVLHGAALQYIGI